MEKTSRPGDNAQSLNAYERKKMLRVQENQAKLRELGVKNVFNSLTSLAENHSAKNKKEKSKDAKEKDPEYVPNFNDENDGDGEEESATSFSAPKKANKRQQYIPPMSMSRYLTKQREAMKNYIPPEDGKCSTDPFLGVMPKEYDGYRRLYGRGVTNKMLKKVNGSGSSYMVSEEFLESLKANVEVEKRQLLDMRKEIEEDHERKKAELQEMKNDLESQHEKLLQDAVQKILGKLPSGIVREYLI